MKTKVKQIYKSLSFKKKEEEKNFDIILGTFEAYFMPKKNIIQKKFPKKMTR